MNATRALESWGRYPKVSQKIVDLAWISELLPFSTIPGTVLPYGKGRSYGDVCLNDGGTLLATRQLDHFIAFDAASGRIRCEAGVTLDEILQAVVPRGWFLPVTPGTKFVTVAGAVANDVHGKNHHRMGTFGEHVFAFELLRSDGSQRVCTPSQNKDFFRATIGGMGLTGLILWVEFQLKRIQTPYIEEETIKHHNLTEFFRLVDESESAFEYTVSWMDCLAGGSKLGRGIFMRGNDARLEAAPAVAPHLKGKITFPFDAPNFLLNRFTVSAFNTVYYHKQIRKQEKRVIYFDPFFYPLDSVLDWNRVYGKRGFFQYQFVVPHHRREAVVPEILEKIVRRHVASFLAVIKTFGNRPAAGMMSFPRPGVTLALDLPNLGDKLLRLLDELDDIVLREGGGIYPAKDARMSPECFQASFPQWKEFAGFIDPKFSSSFWRRVTETRGGRAL